MQCEPCVMSGMVLMFFLTIMALTALVSVHYRRKYEELKVAVRQLDGRESY